MESEIMSVTLETTTGAEPYDHETAPNNVTYTFKPTDENKTENPMVALDDDLMFFVRERSARSARWRSMGQFMCDALNYYVNYEDESEKSVNEIVDNVDWSSENTVTFAVTPTLFKEIELLVKNTHTEWDSKQEFYICAIQNYVANDFPVVERR